jgi:hypothetical protein
VAGDGRSQTLARLGSRASSIFFRRSGFRSARRKRFPHRDTCAGLARKKFFILPSTVPRRRRCPTHTHAHTHTRKHTHTPRAPKHSRKKNTQPRPTAS